MIQPPSGAAWGLHDVYAGRENNEQARLPFDANPGPLSVVGF
jgi:hypothetical protein